MPNVSIHQQSELNKEIRKYPVNKILPLEKVRVPER